MCVEFCIWGCGNRGKNVYRVMMGKNVRAFIDENPDLQGKYYQDVPIISFETYLKKYQDCIIIVTPYLGSVEIEQRLQGNCAYLSTQNLLQEFANDGIKDLLYIASRKIGKDETVYLYGLNLFSVCLLSYLESENRRAKIIPEPGADSRLIKTLKAKSSDCIGALAEIHHVNLYLTSEKYDISHLSGYTLLNLYDFMNDCQEYRNPKIRKFQDIHKGKRCFIIGCGPSLRVEDLDKLAENHELCISVNGILRVYPETKWRPQYYLISDPFVFNMRREELLKNEDVPYMLIADECLKEMPVGKFIKYHQSYLPIKNGYAAGFSKDFSKGAYNGGTVIYTCIQFAAYLGCNELYLYGLDHTFSRHQEHFVKDYLSGHADPVFDAMTPEMLVQSMEAGYRTAKQAMKSLGIKIYNASRKTALDVFERVDFDTLFT